MAALQSDEFAAAAVAAAPETPTVEQALEQGVAEEEVLATAPAAAVAQAEEPAPQTPIPLQRTSSPSPRRSLRRNYDTERAVDKYIVENRALLRLKAIQWQADHPDAIAADRV